MAPKIPFLPGNSAYLREWKDEWKKPQSLQFKNGYAVRTPKHIQYPTEATIEELSELLAKTQTTLTKMTYGEKQFHIKPTPLAIVPSFIAYDKVTLSFDAYLKEKAIIRQVKIYFYPEDETISVMEPPIPNSGLMQGTLIKRHRIPKQLGTEDFIHASDLKVGGTVSLYSKDFHIVDCDDFTRKFMSESCGLIMAPALPMPHDKFFDSRPKPSAIKPSQTVHLDKLQKFLENDRKVLRFYSVWDDTQSMYGECRDFIIHYFLVDDSVEVREIQKPNSGRDQVSVLLRRQQLPKVFKGLPSLNTADMITWQDLRIGKVLDILGRPFLLKDCDAFTRDYYISHNVCAPEELRPVQYAHNEIWEQAKVTPPPYNGYGTIEDSLISCRHLVLKPPRKDFKKLVEYEQHALRFIAKLVSKYPEDVERRFIITYRLADDTVSITEQKKTGDGLSGRFLEKTQALRTGSTLYDADGPQYLTPADFVIGTTVEINHYKFVLLEGDEFTFRFMEQKPDLFPASNRQAVVDKICSVAGAGEAIVKAMVGAQGNPCAGSDCQQCISRDGFVQACMQTGLPLSHQEWITLARSFEQDRGYVDVAAVKKYFC